MVQPQTTSPARYTVEEYMALEATADQRHEFYQGEVRAMAGATANHNTLVLRCAFQLLSAETRGCRVFTENVQLAVADGRFYTYPDVMATCHDEDVQAERTMRNPVLLLEVLSPSTADYDRVWKRFRYQQLPSLRHYLLVSQQYQAVDWYHRATDTVDWQHQLLTMPEEAAEIPELATRLLLADIYATLNIPLVTDDNAGREKQYGRPG
ncbi:Uma2 family endonuclease [Hymenobacter rubripertinctus]|uniref:Uma2 family endonuclease n=1 Tax=Hymenobacter rubripertinctus TaxID=2029981 RepID=A0A418R1V2_9BACT|nr:Uma2 family endonuclease [Hymenobacter rubripertinctus]RIY11364.1 Uma2 family endonuclease [Hymenobacter rubripertinctus]